MYSSCLILLCGTIYNDRILVRIYLITNDKRRDRNGDFTMFSVNSIIFITSRWHLNVFQSLSFECIWADCRCTYLRTSICIIFAPANVMHLLRSEIQFENVKRELLLEKSSMNWRHHRNASHFENHSIQWHHINRPRTSPRRVCSEGIVLKSPHKGSASFTIWLRILMESRVTHESFTSKQTNAHRTYLTIT